MSHPIRLGRYELGEVLGEGGAGRVLEATLLGPGGLRKAVAVKLLRGGGEALRREAQIGGLLRHRNLVDVYEVGEEEGTWFCAMERCAGCLADHAPLPPRAVVEVGLAVCAALQYAHEELGLIHLDLKPANLLFGEDGTVKVADLGIARAEGFEADGRVRGTPGYMAPEQARGAPVDARTDVFALAITLAELAGGDPTEISTTGAWLAEPTTDRRETARFDDPGTPTRPAPTTPEWLEAVLEPCLGLAPEDRPSVAELAQSLRALEPNGPGLLEHLGPLARVGEPIAADPLATEPDTFVGRQSERAALEEALERPGLLTLKGPAGVGKTRLALAQARHWRAVHRRPVWFCPLSEARDQSDLARVMAAELGLRLGQRDAIGRLGRVLAGQGPCLLILDVFEHLDCADAVARLLADAPELRVLVTSRVPLALPDERVMELDVLSRDDACALLVARARDRGVELADDADLPELANRLDRLPLALELAAGRLGVLSVRDVLDRLELGLLRSGRDDRHGTLSAALDWSWERLGPVERTGLAQLSVFRGGASLAAAEAVLELPGETDVLDVVDALIDHSWLTVRGDRLVMLRSVRTYASARLEEPAPVETRHGTWFAGLARRAAPVGGRRFHATLRAELENLLAATRRARNRDTPRVALDCLEAAWYRLTMTGPVDVALALGDDLPDRVEAEERPRAMLLRARVHERMGRIAEAMEVLQTTLDLARARGDLQVEGMALGRMAAASLARGRPDDAYTHAAAALVAHRAAGDRRAEVTANGLMGVSCRLRGDLEGARRFHGRALALAREVGDRMNQGVALSSLGNVHKEQGQLARAERLYHEALAVHRELGNHRSQGLVLGNLASVARIQGRFERSRELSERAIAFDRAVGHGVGQAIELSNLASLELHQGRLGEAEQRAAAALVLARKEGEHRLEGHILGVQGRILHARGQHDEARSLLARAIDIAHDTRSGRQEAIWRLRLARIEIDEERASAALDEIDAAEPLLRTAGDDGHLSEAHALRAEALWVAGESDRARDALQQAHVLAPADHADLREALERATERIEGGQD